MTGVAFGIGLECATAMLQADVRVALVDHDARKVADIGGQPGPNALPVAVDLRKPKSVAGMLSQILEKSARSTSSPPVSTQTSNSKRPKAIPTPGTGCPIPTSTPRSARFTQHCRNGIRNVVICGLVIPLRGNEF